jgi:hypothetical protein
MTSSDAAMSEQSAYTFMLTFPALIDFDTGKPFERGELRESLSDYFLNMFYIALTIYKLE